MLLAVTILDGPGLQVGRARDSDGRIPERIHWVLDDGVPARIGLLNAAPGGWTGRPR